MIDPAIFNFIPVYLWRLIISGLLGFVFILLRNQLKALKAEWQGVKTKLESVDTKIEQATSNHLHTIEGNTGKTVEILERMERSSAELAGYLKAKL